MTDQAVSGRRLQKERARLSDEMFITSLVAGAAILLFLLASIKKAQFPQKLG